MGFQKLFPETDNAILEALLKPLNLITPIVPSNCPISLVNRGLLTTNAPLFESKLNFVSQKESIKHKKVTEYQTILKKLKGKVTNGFKLVVGKVKDGDIGFDSATLALYKLPLSGKLPKLNTEAAIKKAALDFIAGETAREAAGGDLLTDVSKADVDALLTELLAKEAEREAASDALVAAIAVLQAFRPTADDVVKKIWDDIEFYTKDMEEGARHTFSTNWGMVFIHVADFAYLNVTILNDENGEPIAGAKLRIGKPDGKGGAKGVTTNAGTKEMKSKNFGETFVIAEAPGFISEARAITLAEGQTLDITIRMKRKPKSA